MLCNKCQLINRRGGERNQFSQDRFYSHQLKLIQISNDPKTNDFKCHFKFRNLTYNISNVANSAILKIGVVHKSGQRLFVFSMEKNQERGKIGLTDSNR